MTAPATGEAALRPCPFPHEAQGARVARTPSGRHVVICDECGCEGPDKATPEEAIAAWNTRASLEGMAGDLAEALRAALWCSDKDNRDTTRERALLARYDALKEKSR